MLRKRLHAGDPVPTSMTDLVVMASGNLGIVSFTGPKHRVTLEEIERDQPDAHRQAGEPPGVGFVMVATNGAGGAAANDAAGAATP